MSTEPGTAATPSSIFISYASADRPQARLLGEALTQAGLDVWFDEEELAGGESWDAKIRQQIRTCTYFMPVISATTEARREGYFRREWRLAVERTLDLADDVTFLVPVVIDHTSEYKARVPEKFTTVQWLRCPDGRATPQLLTLARRLAAEPTALAAPPPPPPPARAVPPKLRTASASSSSTSRDPATSAASGGLPPFPIFPAFPDHGNRARFLYDLIIWAGHLLRALWARLPRWLRVLAMIVIVFKAINGVFRLTTGGDDDDARAAKKTATAKKIAQSLATTDKDDTSPVAQKILNATSAALDSFQSGRPLALITFATTDASVAQTSEQAFSAFNTVLTLGDREARVAVGAVPLPANYTDADALARATVLKCHWLIAGTTEPAGDDNFSLTVRLYDATRSKVAYYARRTGSRDEAAELGRALATDVLTHVKFDEPVPAPPEPPK